MTKEIFEKLLERTIFVFLSGVILLLLGASGEFILGSFSFQISENFWRISLSVMGVLLIVTGIILQLQETSSELPFGKMSLSVSNVMTDWNQDKFVQRLETAVDVRMIAVSNYDLISKISEEIEGFVNRGGKLQCLYVSPDGHALNMVSMRSVGVEKDIKHLQNQYTATIEILQNLESNVTKKKNIQVRKIDYLNSAVLTLVDPLLDNGMAYITVNGFGKHFTDRPCLVLPKSKNTKWFNFFFETFDNAWESSDSSEVPLQQKTA